MTAVDVFGSLVLDPVPVLANKDTPGDPLLEPFGDFCKAVLLGRCSDAWADIGTGNAVVESVSYNNPEDNTFNEVACPALFVFRNYDKAPQIERYADCLFWRISTLVVEWVPPPSPQDMRATRAPFYNAIMSALTAAVVMDRYAGWAWPGDTDTFAAKWGSSLKTICGLSREIAATDDVKPSVFNLKIQMADGMPRNYEALRFEFTITEDYDISGQMRGYVTPPKLDATITEQSRTVEAWTDGITP